MPPRTTLSCAALLLCLLALAAPASAAPPTVTLQSGERYFSPDGDGHEDTIGLSYQVSERSRVSITVVDTGGEAVRRIQTDVPTEGGMSFTWDGRRDASTAIAPDGVYRYRVTAVNEAGESASAERRIGIDTGPVGSITAPAADATVTGKVRVTVTPGPGRALTSGTLYRCYYAGQCVWQGVGGLGAADPDGTRSLEWDTQAGSTGDAWLWGYVYYDDAFGTAHSYPLTPRHVVVQRPVTVTVNSAARSFSPDGDGHEDAYGIGYAITAPGTVSVRIRDAAGAVVRRLATDVFVPEGGTSVAWDGRDDGGATVPDGEYTYSVDVVGAVGPPASATGRVGVDTAPVAQLVAPDEGAVVNGVVAFRVAPAAGRALTGGTLYGCYYAGRCVWYGVGSLGEPDAFGVRSLSWDSAPYPTGEKWVWGYAYYKDAYGADHQYPLTPRRVVVQRPVTLSLSSAERYFSPDGDGNEDTIGISYAVTAPGTATISVSDASGALVRRIASGVAVAEGGQSFAWDGRDEDGARVPDGIYTYSVQVQGAIGDPVVASRRVGVDTQPVAEFVAPDEGAVADGVLTFRVAPATGRALTGGTLYACYYSARCVWYGLGSLNAPDAFGTWSVPWNTASYPTGEKWVWGYAYYKDAFGADHQYPLAVRRVVVQRAVGLTVSSSDRSFSPDGDGSEDTVGFSYVLTAPATVTIRIRDEAGGLVRRVETDVARLEGGQSFSWDGRDEDGARVPDGVYRYTIDAAGVVGPSVSAGGRVGVDTQPVAALSTPATDAVITGSVRVKVAPAAGRTLSGGTMYLCYYEGRCVWQGLGSLGVPDFDGTRGLDWNTAATATGPTWVWGYAYYKDAFGADHSYALAPRRVVVTRAVQISNVSTDRYFTPDGDGQEETGGPSYCIDAPADMRLAISRDGEAVRTLRSDDLTQGCHGFSWDGRDEAGARVPAGGFAYALVATGAEGLATTVTGRIGVRLAPPGRVLRPTADDVLSRSAAFTFTPDDVPVTEVTPCVTTGVCFPITAANAAGQWATSMALTPQLNGDRTLRVSTRWRDPYGSAHETALPAIPVTVNTVAPEVELEATPAGGEAPVAGRIRLDARSESGRVLNYRLDFGDGTPVVSGTVASPYAPVETEHAFARPGVYRVLADVDDGAGNGARRSTVVTVTAPPNRAPTATLKLDRDEGNAPFAVAATIAGADADGDPLTYRVSFGDGSPEQTGELPHAPLTHTYTTAGSFLVRLSVSDGEQTTTRTARVVTTLPEPLTAAAGDDQHAQAGERVAFDGGGSRPAALITDYAWEFGDGTTATGRAADHTYTRAGTYTVTLTTRAGTATAKDTAVVTVADPPPADRVLSVRVTGGGAAVGGATVTYVAADGSRVSATSAADGSAGLRGLPDGTHTLYVYAPGYRPRTATATVADGRGEATVELDRGELGATTLEHRRMTLAEILAAGIDVDDPANTHVYEAKVHLWFDPVSRDDDTPPVGRTVHLWYWDGHIVCASNCGGGGGGGGGGASPCPEADTLIGCWVLNGYQYLPTLTYVEGKPFIHWLVLPMRASFLKAFFDVHLIVQNLADPGFTFEPGVAGLQLPAGLSLAPLPTPQSATQDVGAIEGGRSRSVDWVVRGDTEGRYDLSATYSSTLAPIDAPVFMTARTRTPVDVYGASALKTRIVLDCYAQRWGPYGFEVEITNVKDAPVYNLEVEMLEQEADKPAEHADFFYAAAERRQRIAELAPGATFRARYTVFAGLGQDDDPRPLELSLSRSFVQRTGGDVDLAPELVKRNPCPAEPPAWGKVYQRVEPSGGGERAVITWDRPEVVPPDKSITGYQLWTRQRLDAGEWKRYGGRYLTEAATIPDTDRDVGRYYLIATEHGPDDVRYQHLIGVGPSRYVSLGDSFSSGEGVPAFDPGTAGDVHGDGGNKCHRSKGSYGRLIADDDGIEANLTPMTADACSGAIAADVWKNSRRNPDEGPQQESVNRFTDVITLSMGGNDIGFRDIAIACILPAIDCSAGALDVLGSEPWLRNFAHVWDDAFTFASDVQDIFKLVDSCTSWANIAKLIFCRYRADRVIDDFEEAIEPNWRVSPMNLVDNDLRDRLVSAYEGLLGRAPKAQLYVMPYPKIVDGVDVAGDCELLGPGEPAFTRGDRRAIARVIDLLNTEIHAAVRATNSSRVTYVELGDEFDELPLCKNGKINPASGFNSATNPYFSTPGNYGPISYAFHPNAYGQQAYARALKGALTQRITPQRVLLDLGQTVDVGTLQPAAGASTLQAAATWPGSTVSLSFVSPAGAVVDERSPNVTSTRTATSHRLVVANPQPGTWKVRVTGDDVHEDEPVDVEASTTRPDTAAPAVSARAERVGETASTYRLIADGPAGATHTWSFSDGAVATGARVDHRFTNPGALWATLRTTAADGQVVWTPVTVRAADAAAPAIATPTDVTVEATSGAGAAVPFALPAAEDSVGAAVKPVCAPAPGTVFPLGATTVTCTATAGGKSATSRFTVRVRDTTAPAFGPAPDVRTAAFAVPAATDAVDGAVAASCSPGSGAPFVVGATAVTCSATDRAGNTATIRFTVTIDPVTGPAPKTEDPPKPLQPGRAALKRVTVRGRTVSVQVMCPAGTSGCAAVRARLVVKRVVVGTGRGGALASGKSATLTVKLNAKGRAQLKRGRLKATVELRQGSVVLGKRAVTVRR